MGKQELAYLTPICFPNEVLIEDLPLGTTVYLFTKVNPKAHIITEDFRLRWSEWEFYYDPADELYASEAVRKLWLQRPATHPHYSLFGALYNQLSTGKLD